MYIYMYIYPVLIPYWVYKLIWAMGIWVCLKDRDGLPVYGLVRTEWLIKGGILEFVIFVQRLHVRVKTDPKSFRLMPKTTTSVGPEWHPFLDRVPFRTFLGERHSSSRDCQKSLGQLYFAFLHRQASGLFQMIPSRQFNFDPDPEMPIS